MHLNVKGISHFSGPGWLGLERLETEGDLPSRDTGKYTIFLCGTQAHAT